MLAALSDVHYRYKSESEEALRGVSLGIERGEILGLIGPDGAGKTTLMRLLAGVLTPSGGSLQLPGEGEGNSVGYMSQRFSLYEDLSISENMRLTAALRDIPATQAAAETGELLRLAGLEPFTERLAGKLSGGMKQKLAMICAMQGKPQLLLLDEPGVGVDPVSRRELWKIAEMARQSGCSIVWRTSYPNEIAGCDRVCVLHEGRVLYLGRPSVLTDALRGRVFTREAAPEQRIPLLRRLQADPEVKDAMPEGGHVRFLLRHAEAASRFVAEGAVPAEPGFEECFVDLLGGEPAPSSAPAPDAQRVGALDGQEVIVTDRLTRRFGSFVATDALSIRVRRGEIFGILGANGAGKTTAFRMICGLLPPSEGRAEILGIDLRREARKIRSRIGYMAQKFSLYPNLTVLQNLRFFGAVYGLPARRLRAAIEDAAERYELRGVLNSRSGELPLGTKQRLSMACATLHEPDFLFLDEPTSGVDPLARRSFWRRINEMAAAGVTIIVTTHFMDEAQYTNRMVIMNRGRVIAQGSPDELKRAAASPSCPDPTMEDAFIHFLTEKGATS